VASANLELVRALYAAWGRGESGGIDWAHPEIEFVIADGPEPGRWRGLAGMAEGFRDLVGAWEEWRPRADAYRELDGERVLVLDHFSGRGKVSGLEIGRTRTEGAVLFHLRGGKVTKAVVYWDRERALADLGIAPVPDSPLS
jgi:ketosteroid isomerase-like protein